MHGYTGKVLFVDLTQRTFDEQAIPDDVYRGYLAGIGLAAHVTYRRMPAGADPLGPGNVLGFVAGILTGTGALFGGRWLVTGKSPLTGGWGDANCGGTFGPAIKQCGYDGIFFTGAASEPVYLYADGERTEIRSAADLWGLDATETEERLMAASTGPRKARVACIGPAGENLVRIAAVANDRNRVYGRCGPGAVWGAKNLKAVRVAGREKIAYRDKERYQSGYEQSLYLMRQAPVTKRLMRELGTAGLVELINVIRMLPHRNFQDTIHDESLLENVSGETIARTILERAGGCFLCPIGCQRHTRLESGGRTERGEGPEYETVVMMGPVCDVYDLAAITRANYRCNELGIDTMSFGGTLACAMELAERGAIPAADLEGLDLRFGRGDLEEDLVKAVAHRRGIGDAMAEGASRLAARYGRPELAMTVKKLEIPGYDPRASFTQALGYMTSPSGACHLRGGYSVSLAFFGGTREIPRFSLLQSPIAVRNMQNKGILQDSLGICRFTGFAFDVGPWARMMTGVTGLDFSEARLEEIANRIAALERLFNFDAGATRDDDALPSRFTEIPITVAGVERSLSPEAQEKMRSDYYRIRGWDETGRPAPALLERLRIERTPR